MKYAVIHTKEQGNKQVVGYFCTLLEALSYIQEERKKLTEVFDSLELCIIMETYERGMDDDS